MQNSVERSVHKSHNAHNHCRKHDNLLTDNMHTKILHVKDDCITIYYYYYYYYYYKKILNKIHIKI